MTKPELLRNLIHLSGCVTQKSFAEKHNTRSEIISKWLSGKRNISNKTLETIAKKEGYQLTIELKLKKL